MGAGGKEGPGARPALLEAWFGLEEPGSAARPKPGKMAPDRDPGRGVAAATAPQRERGLAQGGGGC